MGDGMVHPELLKACQWQIATLWRSLFLKAQIFADEPTAWKSVALMPFYEGKSEVQLRSNCRDIRAASTLKHAASGSQYGGIE